MSDQLSPLPLPKTLLHYICFICLVGWGASAIAVASQVGTMAPWLEWARELASQFFFGLLAFGFFYIQFVAVERFAARELNFTFGHIQVLGGLALFLVGIVRDAAALILNAPQFGSNGLGSTLLFYICVLGEGMLLANVVVTYALPQGVAAARPAALVAVPAPWPRATTADLQKVAAQFDWSNSPAVLFAIAAAFFFVAGVVLVSAVNTRVPVLKAGAISYVSPGYLWMPLAIPFAIFAVIYWLIEIFKGWTFDHPLRAFIWPARFSPCSNRSASIGRGRSQPRTFTSRCPRSAISSESSRFSPWPPARSSGTSSSVPAERHRRRGQFAQPKNLLPKRITPFLPATCC